jgi:uncharacterized membrane protein
VELTGCTEPQRSAAGSLSDQISQNIESVVALQRRELETTTVAQRRLEWISRLIGRPAFLLGLVSLTGVWIALNLWPAIFSLKPFDPYPFALLQGLLTFSSLFTTTIVLIAQNRQTKLEQQHTHLDLQVNLLTEQKVTKLIHLIEELRHDLPMVKDRHDPQAAYLQERADTSQVLSAIEEVGLTKDIHASSTTAGSKT